jgi:hypothetical protein
MFARDLEESPTSTGPIVVAVPLQSWLISRSCHENVTERAELCVLAAAAGEFFEISR